MGAIWNKTFIKAFYREQTGFFLFVFLIFFGLVQPSTQLYFHYALIRGILEAPAFMALVGLAWGLYGLRVRRFILGVLTDPDALFLSRANAQPAGRTMTQCVKVVMALFGPVMGYAAVIIGVAINKKAGIQALEVLGWVVLLILGMTVEMRYRLRYPGITTKPGRSKRMHRRVPYWSILLRSLLAESKGILIAVKIFSCGMLYLLLRLQTPEDYDLRMPFLTYSLALFGHSILLYRCRQLEGTRLTGYKALPVPAMRRLIQYAWLGFLLLLPETILLAWLTPHPLRPIDGLAFAASGYIILLVLYSILLAWTLKVADYLKLCLVLFGILYCFAMKAWG